MIWALGFRQAISAIYHLGSYEMIIQESVEKSESGKKEEPSECRVKTRKSSDNIYLKIGNSLICITLACIKCRFRFSISFARTITCCLGLFLCVLAFLYGCGFLVDFFLQFRSYALLLAFRLPSLNQNGILQICNAFCVIRMILFVFYKLLKEAI